MLEDLGGEPSKAGRSLMQKRTIGILIAMFVASLGLTVGDTASINLSSTGWGASEGKVCMGCHQGISPSLVEEWRLGAMGQAGVNCYDCHRAGKGDADTMDHYGLTIALLVTPKDCGRCHEKETKETIGSQHAKAGQILNILPNRRGEGAGEVAVGALDCHQCHGSKIVVLENGRLDPTTWPNTGIGRINPDGVEGTCSACHTRHRFSKQQARKPKNCETCHLDPDHLHVEVHKESKQRIPCQVFKSKLNTDRKTWIVGLDNVDTPVCSACHMGATSSQDLTHDMGRKISWALRPPLSKKMDARGKKMENRKEVCFQCQGVRPLEGSHQPVDEVLSLYNDKFVRPATEVRKALIQAGKLTPADFDEPLDRFYWALWHHEDRRVHRSASTSGPDQAGLDGLYDVEKTFYLRFVPEAEMIAGEELADTILGKHIFSMEEHRWYREVVTKERRERIRRSYK